MVRHTYLNRWVNCMVHELSQTIKEKFVHKIIPTVGKRWEPTNLAKPPLPPPPEKNQTHKTIAYLKLCWGMK